MTAGAEHPVCPRCGTDEHVRGMCVAMCTPGLWRLATHCERCGRHVDNDVGPWRHGDIPIPDSVAEDLYAGLREFNETSRKEKLERRRARQAQRKARRP